jgi:osmoprotectant transport system substrate-binding protein
MSVRSGNAAAGVPGRRPRGRLWSVVLLVMVLAGCQSFGSASDSGSDDDAPRAVTGPITVGGADFTEMRIMQALYGQLLTEAGLEVRYRTSPTREAYTRELEAGSVHVVPEYAATFTEFLNREVNGPDATLLASSDPAATVARLRALARERGLAVLAPAQAANQNGFAVTAQFARQEKITDLSQLAARGTPVVLAATPECSGRPFCQLGLQRVYGLKVSSVLPLGFGSAETKQALIDGQAGLALVGTTDGTLTPLGLRLLADDKKLQLADNLIPAVNADAAADPRLAAALDPLAAVLTTSDLADMNEQVDGERRSPEAVATGYLKAKRLL